MAPLLLNNALPASTGTTIKVAARCTRDSDQETAPFGYAPCELSTDIRHFRITVTFALALLEQAVRLFLGHLVLRRHVREQQAQP
jgi:hypothetical protein